MALLDKEGTLFVALEELRKEATCSHSLFSNGSSLLGQRAIYSAPQQGD